MQNTSGTCFLAFTGRSRNEAATCFSPNAIDDVHDVLWITSSAMAKRPWGDEQQEGEELFNTTGSQRVYHCRTPKWLGNGVKDTRCFPSEATTWELVVSNNSCVTKAACLCPHKSNVICRLNCTSAQFFPQRTCTSELTDTKIICLPRQNN